jgi:hypothetical protein
MAGYAKPDAFPERFAQLGIPTLLPVTPGEFISWNDRGNLKRLLEAYLLIPRKGTGSSGGIGGGGSEISAFQALVEAYGASGHEENVRKVVLNRLDPRLQKKVEMDSAGNLLLHLGNAKPGTKPSIAFVAHMDEIGYEVKKIEDDGRLLVSVLGGGYAEYFQGHIVFIQKSDGTSIGGVLELPGDWDQPGFEMAARATLCGRADSCVHWDANGEGNRATRDQSRRLDHHSQRISPVAWNARQRAQLR